MSWFLPKEDETRTTRSARWHRALSTAPAAHDVSTAHGRHRRGVKVSAFSSTITFDFLVLRWGWTTTRRQVSASARGQRAPPSDDLRLPSTVVTAVLRLKVSVFSSTIKFATSWVCAGFGRYHFQAQDSSPGPREGPIQVIGYTNLVINAQAGLCEL